MLPSARPMAATATASLFTVVVVIFSVIAAIVRGIWTCSSTRDASSCCMRYQYVDEDKPGQVLTGSRCRRSPWGESRLDSLPIETAAPQPDNMTWFCESIANGYATEDQKPQGNEPDRKDGTKGKL